MIRTLRRPVFSFIAICASLALAASSLEARPGKSSNMGSRGTKTYSAPPATNTAPTTARPIERSATPAPAAQPSMGQPQRPAQAMTPPAAQPSFGRTLLTGLGAGLLGAGLFGLLSGSGFFAGLGSLAGFFGFLLQAGLIALLAYLAIRFFRSRSAQPAMAGGPVLRQATGPATNSMGANAAPARPAVRDGVGIHGQDYAAFEQLLYKVQAAYSAEDRDALAAIVTPEMLGYFGESVGENIKRGVRNDIAGVKLLQGDLSESWREHDLDYATLAMRFSITDTMVDRTTGKVVEGGKPEEVTEVWTFVRGQGHDWTLSAIQQV